MIFAFRAKVNVIRVVRPKSIVVFIEYCGCARLKILLFHRKDRIYSRLMVPFELCLCVCLLNLFHLSTIFVRWNKVRDFLAHRLVINELQYRVHQPKNYVFSSIHSHSIIITYCAWTILFNFLDWCMSYLPFDRPSFMRNSIAADRTSEEGLEIEINELQQFLKNKELFIRWCVDKT